jgi:hypothetical protein
MLAASYLPIEPVRVERKIVESIENASLTTRQKAELLLVYAGKKPATVLEITDNLLSKEEVYLVSQKRLLEVEDFLKKVPLSYRICGRSILYGEGPPHEEIVEIAVARSEFIRDELVAAIQKGEYDPGAVFS